MVRDGRPAVINLSGWQIRDALDHSYGLCADSIAPGEFLLCSGIFSLNNGGDTIKLVDGGNNVVDAYSYGTSRHDVSWSRTVDGGGVWTDAYPPSPGAPNQPATDTPTPTVTLTPSPTPTSTRYPLGVMLNEFLPSPKDVDWDGNGTANLTDEWYGTLLTTHIPQHALDLVHFVSLLHRQPRPHVQGLNRGQPQVTVLVHSFQASRDSETLWLSLEDDMVVISSSRAELGFHANSW